MSLTKRITELERKAGEGPNLITVVYDDRQEYIDFVKWMKKALTGENITSVEIPPEIEKIFRPPFSMPFTREEIEGRDRVITEWLSKAQGGPGK